MVYESGKSGHRFLETQLKLNANSLNSTANEKQIITIDRNQKFQSILGFGGAFTDEFGMVLNAVPKELAGYLMDGYYGKNGIEYNMGRVPVAATDYSAHYYTYDDNVDDKQLTKYALAKEDLELKVKCLIYYYFNYLYLRVLIIIIYYILINNRYRI